MRKATPAQYKKAAVIVHGKSERFLASYIYTNLHLPVVIIDKNKGRSSIQINGLKKYSAVNRTIVSRALRMSILLNMTGKRRS